MLEEMITMGESGEKERKKGEGRGKVGGLDDSTTETMSLGRFVRD